MNALHKVSVPAWPAHASPATKVCWAVWKTPCRSVPCACTSPGTQEQGLCLIMAWLSMAMEENVKDEPHLGKQSQTNSISPGAAHTTNRMDLWPRASSDATGTAQAPCRKRLHGGLSPLSMNKCGARQSLASCVCMGESALRGGMGPLQTEGLSETQEELVCLWVYWPSKQPVGIYLKLCLVLFSLCSGKQYSECCLVLIKLQGSNKTNPN